MTKFCGFCINTNSNKDNIHQIYAPNEAQLSEFIGDAFRFAQTFARSMEEHPLLVYMSALPMTPTNTTLYQTFHDPALCPSVLGGFQSVMDIPIYFPFSFIILSLYYFSDIFSTLII
jgi:hypothetical protein